jgi:hypothetical protein
MSMTHEDSVLNPELRNLFDGLQAFLQEAARDGSPLHEVEHALWKRVLGIGRHALQLFFNSLGNGDMGETLALPDRSLAHRLPELHARRYLSVFGEFVLQRTVYGSREGQKIDFVPLDNRLELPESVFSYLLQDWDQSLCAEQAFGQVNATIARILGLKQSVDSLEQMNHEMAQSASTYQVSRPVPPAEEEGAFFVASADGKGIVMRRSANDPAPAAHRTKGEKASCKRMATVGAVYSVDRYIRTPEQVVAALFRDQPEQKPPARPLPRHKHVWAHLPQEQPAKAKPSKAKSSKAKGTGMSVLYVWMLWELCRRNPRQAKETVYLHDGQESLWDACQKYLPQSNSVGILDLLHVTPRLWQAAHLFHEEKSQEAETFVRERLLRILRGEVLLVVRGLRVMGTKHGLKANKRKALEVLCGYLERNAERMAYDRYLAAGYPIASGIIEGACRHVVKDRMERAGMHWTPEGAQAMLEVRSIFVSDCWAAFQEYRIRQETKRLYPHRELVEGANFTMAV